jgi:hypothetical protein
VIGLVVGGAGLIGLGLGATFGLMTSSQWDNVKNECGGNPSQCTNLGAAQLDRNSALTDATISTVGFVAGGALLAAGVVVFLTGGNHGPEGGASGTSVAVSPTFGTGQAGVLMSGAF